MTKQNKTAVIWYIAGGLFTFSGVVWTISGNVPIGMMFIVLGSAQLRKSKEQQRDTKDDQPKPKQD